MKRQKAVVLQSSKKARYKNEADHDKMRINEYADPSSIGFKHEPYKNIPDQIAENLKDVLQSALESNVFERRRNTCAQTCLQS